VEFHNVVIWGKQAEVACQFLAKGSLVLIEGRIVTRSWEKDGVMHKATEIVCENMQLGPKPGAPAASVSTPASGAGSKKAPSWHPKVIDELPSINLDNEEIKPEDIPF
jgi:single-strand DNA-binding protein